MNKVNKDCGFCLCFFPHEFGIQFKKISFGYWHVGTHTHTHVSTHRTRRCLYNLLAFIILFVRYLQVRMCTLRPRNGTGNDK